MRNVNIVVKPDEKPSDIIEQICEMEKIRFDDYFAFSAIMTKDNLKINCLEQAGDNPYTPQSLVTALFTHDVESNVRFVVPPVEQYLTTFRPALNKMVSQAYPYYKALIPDRDELVSILYLTVVTLHNKGYYLHNHLIKKTFINALNKEIRKIKKFGVIESLDEEIGTDDSCSTITRLDQLADPVTSQEAYAQFHYTQEDYNEETYNLIKEIMMNDMSSLAFRRLLIQLDTMTIDAKTSKVLAKYREMFNPGYSPRPKRGDK